MSREIDAACARALGWIMTVDGWRTSDYQYITTLPDYSTDHAAAHLLEDEIEKRGLRGTYINALSEIVPGADWTPYENWGSSQVWAFLRATPEQKARAFLSAVEIQS